MQERTREVAATGERDPPPRSPGDAPSEPGPATRVSNGATSPAARRGPVRPERSDDQDLRLESGDQRWTWPAPSASTATKRSGRWRCTRATSTSRRSRRCSCRTAGSAAASPRTPRSRAHPRAERRWQDRGHQRRLPDVQYQSLVADVDYTGKVTKLDATLQQAPGVAITARGTVPASFFQPSTGGHVAGIARRCH